MQVLTEYAFPYLIDNLSAPVIPKFSWFYDAEVNDFMLMPIRLLEETYGPTVTVKINELQFNVPASWFLLVVDEETKLVDTVQISQCSSSNYLAFLMHPEVNDYALSPITLIDLSMKEACTHVLIPRMHLMLHPVGPINRHGQQRHIKADLSYSCLIGPQDLGKYMHGMTAMEVVL